MPMKSSLVEACNEANIFLGLIEHEWNSLLGALHVVYYITRDTRFDLERYLLNMVRPICAIFWYNLASNGKGAKFDTNEADIV